MKKVSISFYSGLVAFVLLLATFAPVNSVAAEVVESDDEVITEDNYDDDGVRDDNYDEENVRDDIYEEEFDWDEDWYWEDVTKDTYYISERSGIVTDETYRFYEIYGTAVNDFVDDKGNLDLYKTRQVFLDKDAIDNLKGQLTLITPLGTSVQFPKQSLLQILKANDDSGVYIELLNVTDKYDDALSEAIQFYVASEGDFTDKFSEPVLVTFKVDPSKVNNWDDLVLRYVDKNGNVTNYTDQIVSWNSETGEVVAKVYHFSTYYIAEVPGSGASKGLGVDNGTAGSTSGSSTNGVDVNVTGGDSTTPSAAGGNVLPATATSLFNIMLAGVFLLAAGIVPLIIKRRKKALQ